ncbi:MAG: DNA translocase FtsK 4TM domain-containing protein [Rickettsiales bacterium]|nr:DNA translocase FtsK 4TM domain-containing protein [Rickettsiales bacterium]
MARTAKKRQKAEAAPRRSFIQRRMHELIGVGLLLVAAYVGASLYSFHPGDPSLNITGEGMIENWGGLIGAYLSDILLQTTGLASWLFALTMMGWGWRFMMKRGSRGIVMRTIMLFIGLITVSGVCAAITPWSEWPIVTGLGGSIGLIVRQPLATFIGPEGSVALLVAISLLAVPLAIGLRSQEWKTIGSWVAKGAVAAMVAARHVIHVIKVALRGTSEEGSHIKITENPRQAKVKTPPKPKLHVKNVTPRGDDDEIEEFEEEAQASFDLLEKHGHYSLPSVQLLSKGPAKSKKRKVSEASLSQNAALLESTLQDFGIKGEITRVRPGPVVTLYELEPAPGVKSSRVIGLADDIARSMSAVSARIAVIPGRNAIGIEMPNPSREMVFLREMFEHEKYKRTKEKLPLVLGKDIGGDSVIADLARMPHLLVAGTTGSGKSVAINTMIMSLIYHHTPEQCRFIMIDPKMLELSVYDGIPHLLSPVVTEPGKAVVALKWTVKEMENRYRLMSNLGVRNIDNYNKRIKDAAKKGEELFRTVQTGFDPETGKPVMEKQPIDMNPLPYIVVVVDEMADLMLVAGKDIEASIQRLAQMARAAGIHIIMATQRPSVDVITGVIKANFPTRISFQVTSKIDSRTILGEQGAEQLLGQGDMLYMAGGGRIQRVHGPFISDKEVEEIVAFLKTQGEPEYVEDVTKDDENFDVLGMGGDDTGDADKQLYDQAVAIVLRDQKASTSYIQRKLKIGYNRAARIIEQMEEDGVVSAANHVGKREVLHRSAMAG